MLAGRRVFIAGGGVAGLAAARAMALRGARVGLAEATPAAGGSGQGGGLQISPNGVRVLDALGIGAEARARAVASRAVVLLDGFTGRVVTRLALSRRAEAGTAWLLFRRSDIVDLLDRAARDAGVEILRGSEVEWLAEDADGVRLRVDGAAREEPLAIAADGFHSGGRALLNGWATPAFTGQVAWRAIVEDDGAPPETRAFLGPGMHLVSYPLTGGGRNIVAVEERAEWAAEGWHHQDDAANLHRAFSSFCPEVRSLLSRVAGPRLWGLFRHGIAARWHGARIALLGDAAHPTLPFMAQGANMALEDAWLLADALDALPPSEAFPRWQALRRPRVARAIAAADANARRYHLRGLQRYAAHRLLRIGGLVAPGLALRQFDWLYRHDVTSAPPWNGTGQG